jgi:hypothetical protein
MHKLFSTLEYLLFAFTGVVRRVESLPPRSGRAGEGLNGLFESLLALSFREGLSENFGGES